VHWEASQEPAELFTLLARDNDPFARWDAGQQLWRRVLLARASGSPNVDLEHQMLEALTLLLAPDGEQDPAVLSTLMAFPGGPELEALQQEADPPALYRAACELREQLGQSLAPLLRERLNRVEADLELAWPEGQGQRQLSGLIWAWLAAAGDSAVRAAALTAVNGPSMTLARAALRALQPLDCPEREEALRQFHDRWQEKPVIFDSWFALEASTPRADGLHRVSALLQHPRFDPMAPNAVRAVLGGFAGNLLVFHAEDGSGYRFMAEQIIALDQRNAITASRLAKVFSRWGTYSSKRQALVKAALDQLSAAQLSPNTREVVEMMKGTGTE
jgi:aminopeptidase N